MCFTNSFRILTASLVLCLGSARGGGDSAAVAT